ncbi:MAG: hypothetical protein JWP57_316, partial [Spirosoma sp.]|nr:hypothetical protein [Spirosoma sp.]
AAVVGDLLEVLSEVVSNGFGLLRVAPVKFIFQFADQLGAHFGEVIDEVKGVLNLVGNACR